MVDDIAYDELSTRPGCLAGARVEVRVLKRPAGQVRLGRKVKNRLGKCQEKEFYEQTPSHDTEEQ